MSIKSQNKRGTVVTFTTVTVDSDILSSQDIERIIRSNAPSQISSAIASAPQPTSVSNKSKTLTESILRSRKDGFNIPEAAAILGTSKSFITNLVNNGTLSRTQDTNPKARRIPKDVLAQFVGSNESMISRHHARVANRTTRRKAPSAKKAAMRRKKK